jgi:serine/threonine-protein kinase
VPLDDAAEALTEAWRARGLTATLEVRSDGTLVASDRQLSIAGAAPDVAPAWAAALCDEPLAVREELGRGGMGVVHVAEQVALRREVAIKRVSEGASARALEAILKEAWVGGHLEHPNVVPVHALATHDGAPTIVMRRVEGQRWRALLAGVESLPEAERADPLGWHLRILTTVCDAVSFAHSRGVLHLDLKPDNVMVGDFGEVYVLDWGLAAGHGEAAPAWLPRASELRSIAGTPDYMAPELAAGAGDRIDERTDVYLLGAILHEICTGHPPHRGATPMQKLLQAYASLPPELGPDVPEELAAIARRALHRERDARFASAAELRAALESFLAHREASEALSEARQELERLEALLAGGAPEEVALFATFGACRFALRKARSMWPEQPEVDALTHRLYARMADWAMDAGRLDLAGAYLAQTAVPSAEATARLEALRRDAAARVAHVEALEHMAREQDLSLGSQFRRGLAIALGLAFVAVNLAMGAAERAGVVELGYREMLLTGALTVLILAPYGFLKRRLAFQNRANVTLFTTCITCFVVVQGLWGVGLALDLPFRTALALTPMVYLLTFGAATMLISARFALSPLLQVPTVLLAASFPEHVYEILGVGGGLSAASIGLTWRDPSEGSAEG